MKTIKEIETELSHQYDRNIFHEYGCLYHADNIEEQYLRFTEDSEGVALFRIYDTYDISCGKMNFLNIQQLLGIYLKPSSESYRVAELTDEEKLEYTMLYFS